MLTKRNAESEGKSINIRNNQYWKHDGANTIVDLEALSKEMEGIANEQ